MKTREKIIEKIKTLGRRKGYKYRHIQTLLEMEGYQRPSLGLISKVLRIKNRAVKRII